MGMYSNSRFLNESFVEVPEANMNYYGTSGANKIIAETIANDIAFFEGVIVSDIQEAYLSRAINEGASELEPNLVALQEASIGGIFKKIGEFFKSIWVKIKSLISRFLIKISSSLTSDNKKLVSKYASEVTRKGQVLEKMSFKWAEVKSGKKDNFEYDNVLFSNDTFDKDISEHIDRLEKAVNTNDYATDRVATTNDDTAGVERNAYITSNKEYNQKVEEKLNDSDFEYNFYGHYLGKEAPNSDGSIAKACHNYFFEEEKILKGQFSDKIGDIKGALSNSSSITKTIETTKKNVDKWFAKSDSRLKSIITKIEKYDVNLSKNSDIYNSTDNTTSQQDNIGRTKFVQKSSIYAKYAGNLQTLLRKESSLVTNLINGQMEAAKFYFKQCRRVWLQAVNFSGKKESAEEIKWLEYIGEAADIDTDSLFEH